LVSGGLDSSALLCLAANAGEVVGINYGTSDDAGADESRYLSVLRSHGLRIDEVPFLPAIDAAAAEQSVREAEAPLVDMVPLTLARAAAHSVMAGAETLLIGTWGDQVLSPFPPVHHRTLAPWRIRRLARAYQAYMTDVPVPEIARALRRQALRQHAPAWVLQRRHERHRRQSIFDILAQNTASVVEPVQRTRTYRDAVVRNIFAPGMQQGIEMTVKWGSAHRVDARLPFLDRELVQFLLTLPDEIAYHGPALKPLLRASMRETVPHEVINRRDKGDYTTVMRRSALPGGVVIEMLDGLRRFVKHDIMSPAAARKTLARMDRNADIGTESDEMLMVLGLDIWLRLFFEK
jgi:asparagine synthase (glutamine-hydrolysing)